MKVIVLGSGVIGVASAWYLAEAGHEVTVVDRQDSAARETSYANAGEVSPGYSAPWAGPGVPLKAIKWLLMQHRPLVIRPHLDMGLIRWGVSMLRNCTATRYEINKGRMVRLAEYSRDVLRELRAATGIGYDERAQGTLQLFRTQKQLDGTGADIEVLKRYGVRYELLDRAGFIRHEPALARVQDKFVGGLLLPGDETGDCFKFTQNLAAMAQRRGVQFRYGTKIERLERSAGRIAAVVTDAGALTADAYLLALGSYSPLLLAPLGIHVPVYPVKGYSITVPITDASGAPESTVMDETHKVAVTRLGDRDRPVPGRRRRGPGRVLVRAAADDTGRHAGRRRHPAAEPLRRDGSRHAGLDHGRRHRARDGRSGFGPHTGHRHGRADDRPLPERLRLTGRAGVALARYSGVVLARRAGRGHRHRARAHAHVELAQAVDRLAVGGERQVALGLDAQRLEAPGRDLLVAKVHALEQARQHAQHAQPPEFTRHEQVELAVGDARARDGWHAAAIGRRVQH
jgi:D-amino-acid dehydrogenase